MSLSDLIAKQKLIICVGAGGVGKTSMAACIGLRAAMSGRKVLVLTIDPAKRLANSLGLDQFGNNETRIDLKSLEEVPGELWAMMLDGGKTFDDLINRLAKDEKTRQAILENNIYRSITDTIVGNQEYMATEKLYDVLESGRYDLVVLDTPPVKNALDFLDSPGRMARFVDKRIMKWFLSEPNEKKILKRLLAGTSAALFRLLGHVFGRDFLEDIAVFFHHFRELYEGFQQRHLEVERIFHSKFTSFLIVTAPSTASLEVAHFFLDELAKRSMPCPGVVVNQRHFTVEKDLDAKSVLKDSADKHGEGLAAHSVGMLMARLQSAHKRLRSLSTYEAKLVQNLSNSMQGGQHIWSVPRLHGEVHDLQSLRRVGDLLFKGD